MKQPFERIVAQHGPAVLRVCRSVLGPQDAEEAWSDTFLSGVERVRRTVRRRERRGCRVLTAVHTLADALGATEPAEQSEA